MRQIIIGVVAGVVASVVLLMGLWYSNSTRKNLSIGKRYMQYFEFDKAILSLEKVLKEDPDNIEANIYIGIAYGKNRKYEAALSHFEAAKKNERYIFARLPAEIYDDVGLIYYLLEKYDEAITEFEKAVQANPKYADAYFNLGVSYSISGRTYEAISSYKKVLEIEPQNSFSHWNLAINLEKLGDIPGAIEHWEKYMEYVPSAFRHPDIQRHINELKGNTMGRSAPVTPVMQSGGEAQ